MTRELKTVVWEWLPGLVAGLMPLLVFLIVELQVGDPKFTFHHPAVPRVKEGLVSHLLVLGIVTSAVSTFTAFPRLFSHSKKERPLGRASLGLVMVITLILVFSVVLYTMEEGHILKFGDEWWAGALAFLAAIFSLFIEFAIANLRYEAEGTAGQITGSRGSGTKTDKGSDTAASTGISGTQSVR